MYLGHYFFIRSICRTLCELWTSKTIGSRKFCILSLCRVHILKILFWIRLWNNLLYDLFVRHGCNYSASFCHFGTLINRKNISCWLQLLFVNSISGSRSSMYRGHLLYWATWGTDVRLSIVMIVRSFFERFKEWVSVESIVWIVAHYISFSKH